MNKTINRECCEDAYCLLEEIPSDESEVFSCSDDELGMNTNLDADNNCDWEWDSDDDLPLSIFSHKKIEWTKDNKYSTVKHPFEQQVGLNIPDNLELCNNLEYPVDMFLLLFPQSLFEKIVFETNLYAMQKHGTITLPTTVDELKSFLAINLLMGTKTLPSYRDCWSSRMSIRDHFISSIMTRDRFGWFLSHLHINDNLRQPKKGESAYDKLYKLRPFLDELSGTYKIYYQPTRCQSIDESMIKFKGRSSMRQYIPMKPIKRGYKVWVRADENGFVSQFQIYTGKTKDTKEKNLGARVIKDLTRDLVGKFHEIYFDNYFNSLQLLNDLLGEGIYACGTAGQGRKDIPTDFKVDKKSQRGEYDWRLSKDGILTVKWMDKKPILFLSNFHSPVDEETVQRKQKDGSKTDVKCLKLVKDYNKHMGYVDYSDMLKSCYELDRKSKKWWHRIFFHFLDLTAVNAFILYKTRTDGAGLSLKQFRLAVIDGLLGAEPTVPQKRRRVSNDKPVNRFKL